jgi:hypothetical protein
MCATCPHTWSVLPYLLGGAAYLAAMCVLFASTIKMWVAKVYAYVLSYRTVPEGGGQPVQGINRYSLSISVVPKPARKLPYLLALLLGFTLTGLLLLLLLSGCPSTSDADNYILGLRRCVVMVTTAGHDGAGDIKCWRSAKVQTTAADGAHLWVGGVKVAVPHALVACGDSQPWQELADTISLPKVDMCEGAK